MGRASYDEITIAEQAVAPSTPASGFGHIYPKPDGKLYYKNSSGVETEVTNSAGGGGISRVVTQVITNITAGSAASTDYDYFITNGSTVTLPSAIANTNTYRFTRTGSDDCTINTTLSQTINGDLTAVIKLTNYILIIQSNGTNWVAK
jgi:hypothetical protein